MTDAPAGPRAPFVVWLLAAAIMGAYLAYMLAPLAARDAIDLALALIPARFHSGSPLAFQRWYEAVGPIFGHAFLHVAWWHAALNAFFFFLLGRLPARRLGAPRFLVLFFVSAAGGALAFLALNWNSDAIAVGASGAVCGVFSAYYLALTPRWTDALANPRIRTQYGMIFFINVVLMGVAAETGLFPVAWEAHLGGFLAGALAYIALAPRSATGPWG